MIILTLVLGLILNNISLANSVEFGQDATGDPNAVQIQGKASGFLYSERIILTAAHVLNRLSIQPNGDTQGFVYAPGVADKTNAKKYQIVKAIIPKTYVSADPARKIQPLDDFAIVIVNEDMPLKIKVRIATGEQMIRFAKEKSKVEMVGYGLQSGSQRKDPQEITRAPHKLSSLLYSPEMMNTFYATKKLNPGDDKPGFWTVVEWGAIQTQATGSACAGDSGSGYFVEEINVRYYVGTAGNGIGISNCQSDGSIKMDPAGGMSWFPAPYKFLDLIESAEKIVEEDKKSGAAIAAAAAAAEMRGKLEAEAKKKAAPSKKTTIKCVKGTMTQKVTAVNPKCPRGYKKK